MSTVTAAGNEEHSTGLTLVSGEREPKSGPEPDIRWEHSPVACEICGRTAELEWHCISEDHHDKRACTAAGGAGYWLCADLCHNTIHQKMAADPSPGSAARVVTTGLRRLAGAVRGGKKYQRLSREQGTGKFITDKDG